MSEFFVCIKNTQTCIYGYTFSFNQLWAFVWLLHSNNKTCVLLDDFFCENPIPKLQQVHGFFSCMSLHMVFQSANM